MKKTLILIIVFLLVVFLALSIFKKPVEAPILNSEDKTVETTAIVSDPLNATYLLEGQDFALVDGYAEKETDGGPMNKNRVSVFGEPFFGDIDNDGDPDAVIILVNEPGGSGTFFYGAIAVNINGEYKGTDSIFLGDRIAPQSFYIRDNRAVINYADRAPGESFTVAPSIAKTIYLQADAETLNLIQLGN